MYDTIMHGLATIGWVTIIGFFLWLQRTIMKTGRELLLFKWKFDEIHTAVTNHLVHEVGDIKQDIALIKDRTQ